MAAAGARALSAAALLLHCRLSQPLHLVVGVSAHFRQSASVVPESGTSGAKMAQNEGEGPELGTTEAQAELLLSRQNGRAEGCGALFDV